MGFLKGKLGRSHAADLVCSPRGPRLCCCCLLSLTQKVQSVGASGRPGAGVRARGARLPAHTQTPGVKRAACPALAGRPRSLALARRQVVPLPADSTADLRRRRLPDSSPSVRGRPGSAETRRRPGAAAAGRRIDTGDPGPERGAHRSLQGAPAPRHPRHTRTAAPAPGLAGSPPRASPVRGAEVRPPAGLQ